MGDLRPAGEYPHHAKSGATTSEASSGPVPGIKVAEMVGQHEPHLAMGQHRRLRLPVVPESEEGTSTGSSRSTATQELPVPRLSFDQGIVVGTEFGGADRDDEVERLAFLPAGGRVVRGRRPPQIMPRAPLALAR